MKTLFQRFKNKNDNAPKIMERISQYLDKGKHHVADYVNVRLARLSPKVQRRVLLSLGLLTMAVCTGLLMQAYNGSAVVLKSFRPVNAQHNSAAPTPTSNPDQLQLLELKNMMDSLQQSPFGKEIYEEIKRQRPGLLDTIDYLLKR